MDEALDEDISAGGDLEAIAEGLRQSFAEDGQPAEDFFKEFENRFKIAKSPEEIRPTAQMQARVNELLAQQKVRRLSADEAVELDCYLELEHLGRMAKARLRLSQSGQSEGS